MTIRWACMNENCPTRFFMAGLNTDGDWDDEEQAVVCVFCGHPMQVVRQRGNSGPIEVVTPKEAE